MNRSSEPATGVSYMSGLLGIQALNAQALATAQQKMLDGVRLLIVQQAQIMEAQARNWFENTQAASSAGDMRSLIGLRIDQLKQFIMETQANSNALSEIMMRSTGEAASTLQARSMASMDEFKTVLQQAIPETVPAPLSRSLKVAA